MGQIESADAISLPIGWALRCAVTVSLLGTSQPPQRIKSRLPQVQADLRVIGFGHNDHLQAVHTAEHLGQVPRGLSH